METASRDSNKSLGVNNKDVSFYQISPRLGLLPSATIIVNSSKFLVKQDDEFEPPVLVSLSAEKSSMTLPFFYDQRQDVTYLLDTGSLVNLIHPENAIKVHLEPGPTMKSATIQGATGSAILPPAHWHVNTLFDEEVDERALRVQGYVSPDAPFNILGSPTLQENPWLWKQAVYKNPQELVLQTVVLHPDSKDESNNVYSHDEEKALWAPYEKELTDLRKHLAEPSKFPVKCQIKIKKECQHLRPITGPVYHMEGEREKTLREWMEKLTDLQVIEQKLSLYRLPIFAVPQKVSPEMEQAVKEKRADPKSIQHFRIVQDARGLNQRLVQEDAPLPRVDSFPSMTNGRPIKSKLDFTKAYFHVEMEEDAKQYVGIASAYGARRWKRMVMGLSTAPGQYTYGINIVMDNAIARYRELQTERLGEIRDDFHTPMKAYIDDVLITTPTKQLMTIALHAIFQTIVKFGLTISPGKCELGRLEIEFLSHVLGKTVKPTQTRMQQLQGLPKPKTIRQLRGWLGAIRYEQAHLPKLATVLAPFDALTKAIPAKQSKQELVNWNEQLQQAWQTVHETLNDAKELYLPDYSLDLYLETDASDVGMGAVLFQEHQGKRQPIGYFSQKFSVTQRRYSTFERELYALRNSLYHFLPYLMGKPAIVLTDHQALIGAYYHITSAPSIKGGLKAQRWLGEIGTSGMVKEIRHISGKGNVVADGLSRIWGEGWDLLPETVLRGHRGKLPA